MKDLRDLKDLTIHNVKPISSTLQSEDEGFWAEINMLCCLELAATHDLIRTSICQEYSGSTKITLHLDHVSHCTELPGTN